MRTIRKLVACTGAASLLLAFTPAFGAETSTDSAPENKQDERQTDRGKQKPPEKQKSRIDLEKPASQVAAAQPVGAPPPNLAPQAVAPIFEERGVLTPRRTLVLEPSFQYVNSSSNRVALSGYTIIPSLNIGLIDVRNVNSNTYVTALTGRYGLTNRLEFEARIPFVYRSDTTTTQPADPNQPATPGSTFEADGTGLGDIEFGPRYQLNSPDGGNGPYFILGLRVKSNTGKDPFEVSTVSDVQSPGGAQLYSELPTGSGFWALQPTLTAMISSDPAVFFGTISYMWNVERDIPGQGKFDPGDTVGFNLGIGFGLNERVSLSIGYDHVVLGKTKKNGEELAGSMITQVGTLLLGCSYKVNESTSFSFSLGAGLTAAASNVQLTLRIPVSFLLGG